MDSGPFCPKGPAGRGSWASSIGVPGFEPGTSATRTQRSTGLSHTPDYSGNDNGRGGMELRSRSDPRSSRGSPDRRFAITLRPLESNPPSVLASRVRVGSNGQLDSPMCPPTSDFVNQRTGWDSNPRGQCPHDFQSCALSHSATRPNAAAYPHCTTESGGSGIRTHAVQAPTP